MTPNLARNAAGADAAPPKSIFPSAMGAALFVLVSLGVAGVALYFDTSVNRVFDVPKAVALKSLAGGAGLAWLVWASIVPIRWSAARIFAAPVIALALVTVVSTVLSIDVQTSIHGVYERQFGLHGYLGCVGLYFVVATTLRGRRGAILALTVLALLGALIGAYAFLQSWGHDPWPFFRKPDDKVYSFLGNATFAGNALALIFPITTLAALTGAHRASGLLPARWVPPFLAGTAVILGLLILPTWLATAGLQPRDYASSAVQSAKVVLRLSFLLGAGSFVAALGLGSWGPAWFRLGSPDLRRSADAFAAGAMGACALLILLGLYATRTRGAWVGTAAAVFAACVFLPLLFRDAPSKMRGALGVSGGGVGLGFLLILAIAVSDSTAGRTIRSIPAAFQPGRSDFGKGQGTRPYLWLESFRVFTEHGDTLARQYEDAEDRAAAVKGPVLDAMPFFASEPPSASSRSFDTAWRSISVWLFGIGIETYRYAFMSHKSKRLEELDPMTNHDNPHNNYLYVLASLGVVGLLAYLWLLGQLLTRAFLRFLDTRLPRWERALAFGVVLSFFSYAVYSIAGFDSVACSVFLYYLLGATAVLFSPEEGGAEATLPEWLAGHAQTLSSSLRQVLREGLGGARTRILELPRVEPSKSSGATGVAWVFVIVSGLLYAHAAWSGLTIFQAEEAFSSGGRTLEDKVGGIKRAIRLSPHESYYRQSLGSTYARAAGQYRQQAQRFRQGARQASPTDPRREKLMRSAQAAESKAEVATQRAEVALMAALTHAWAPENIYISLFQAQYGLGRDREAERALERALRHSPHLGAVRANLAALKMARGAWEEALVDCKWVVEEDRKSALAHRTCGKALLELGRLDEAAEHLTMARRLQP
ncbi:MAG: tetratricopeptide repeat protein, partial [Myxococcota bacterium]